MKDFTTFIQLEPDNWNGYMFRAKAFRALGDETEAIRDEKMVEELENKAMT